jgi:4-carboxymuconolactone decarboxylase
MNQYDRSKGHAKFEEVYGGELPPLPRRGLHRSSTTCWRRFSGALWQDPTLSIRERRLLVIGVLAAQGEEARWRCSYAALLSAANSPRGAATTAGATFLTAIRRVSTRLAALQSLQRRISSTRSADRGFS